MPGLRVHTELKVAGSIGSSFRGLGFYGLAFRVLGF